MAQAEGFSVYVAGECETGFLGTIPPATETLDTKHNVSLDWAALPGSNFQIQLTGQIVVDDAVTIRVYVGGLAPGPISGTVVHSFVLPGTGTYDINELTPSFASPGNRSYLKITFESTPGCNVTSDYLTSTIIPEVASQGLLLADSTLAGFNNGSNETSIGQWIVNFDKISAFSNVLLSFTGLLFNALVASPASNNEYRIRVGGTYGNLDGTQVLLVTAYYPSFAGAVDGGSISFAKPTGKQWLTVSLKSLNAEAVSLTGPSIVLVGV